jgi:4'-phosphopantetheinyl transferase
MSATLSLFDLDLPAGEVAALDRMLSGAERARARTYRFARDATRFVARRGQLRMLLGGQLGRAPDRITFQEGPFGRPYVADGPSFNIASSGAIGLCAIVAEGMIGCDIERRDPRLADRALAERLFAPAEYRSLAALPAERWTETFFDCWTCKEAVVKALGVGLSVPLDAFAVAPRAGDAMAGPLPGLSLQIFDRLPGFSIAACFPAGTSISHPRWFARPCA